MASSRLERIGTIYGRVSSLLRTGAMKEENKPTWLAIYEAFPPKYEPRFDREAPDIPIRNIYYEEDLVLAKFHKDMDVLPTMDLMNEQSVSVNEKFLHGYKQRLKKGLSDTDAYKYTLKEYKSLSSVILPRNSEK